MTGPYEVYVRDGHGVYQHLTGRYAAETLASFWEDQRTERSPMTWQNNDTHPGHDMQGKYCRIVLAKDSKPLYGSVRLATAPFIIVVGENDQQNLNVNYILSWTETTPDDAGGSIRFL